MSSYQRYQLAQRKLELIFGGPVDPAKAVDEMAEKIVQLKNENVLFEDLLMAGAFDAGLLEGCANAEAVAECLSLERPLLRKDTPQRIQKAPAGLIVTH